MTDSSIDSRSVPLRERVRALAVLGLVIGLVLWLGWPLGIMSFGMLCGLVILPSYLVNGLVIPLTIGRRCPGCGERSLAFVSSIPFGTRFYRCKGCGARCHRDDSDEPWEDASGPEFDPYFSGKPPHVPIAWQLGMAAIVLLVFLGMILGWTLDDLLFPGVGLFVSLVCWVLMIQKVRLPPPAPDEAGLALWDRELDP